MAIRCERLTIHCRPCKQLLPTRDVMSARCTPVQGVLVTGCIRGNQQMHAHSSRNSRSGTESLQLPSRMWPGLWGLGPCSSDYVVKSHSVNDLATYYCHVLMNDCMPSNSSPTILAMQMSCKHMNTLSCIDSMRGLAYVCLLQEKRACTFYR
jgi:hypothetical protein